MRTITTWRNRTQSMREEVANSISHGIGFVAALAAAPVLVFAAAQNGGLADVLGATVFASAMVLLYLFSTLSHALPRSRARRGFEELDRMAIYLMIAGTYTPFTLGVLSGAWGWTMLALVWALAATGIALHVLGRMRSVALSVCLYLAMGWLSLIAIEQILSRIPPWGLFWIFAGGGAYTIGLFFFIAKRIPYHHLIWHLFVILGTACHFVAVMWYAV